MNKQEYLEQLKKEAKRVNLIEILICYFLGFMFLAGSIIGIFDPLSVSVYEEGMDPGFKTFIRTVFGAFIVFSLLVLYIAIHATIDRWHIKNPTDIYNDDQI